MEVVDANVLSKVLALLDENDKKKITDLTDAWDYHARQVAHSKKKALDLKLDTEKDKQRLINNQMLFVDRLEQYAANMDELRVLQDQMLKSSFAIILKQGEALEAAEVAAGMAMARKIMKEEEEEKERREVALPLATARKEEEKNTKTI